MEEGGRACDNSSKSRGKGKESVGGCQFATVHEEAPRPTCRFRNCTKGLAVVSLTCWNGTTCQRNMVCNFSCKMWFGRVGPRWRINYRPLFFNIQSEWIAPVVITREQIYRWARWQAVELAAIIWVLKELIQCLVLFGFSNYDHWIEWINGLHSKLFSYYRMAYEHGEIWLILYRWLI